MLYDVASMWNLIKQGTNELLFVKQQQSHERTKQTYGYRGVKGGGINWEIGVDARVHYGI